MEEKNKESVKEERKVEEEKKVELPKLMVSSNDKPKELIIQRKSKLLSSTWIESIDKKLDRSSQKDKLQRMKQINKY